MRRTIAVVALSIFLCGGASLRAQSDTHVIQSVDQAQWSPAPPMLPHGAEIAVLAGNPMGHVPYTIRVKFPPNYSIPAHSHPTDEHVVVVSGSLTLGMGNKLDKSAADSKTLTAGGFALMPAEMNHYAYTTAAETTIVLYGMGPIEFKYVNPADDPRNAK